MDLTVLPVPDGAAVPGFAGLSFDIPVEPVPVPSGVVVRAENASDEAGHLIYVHGGGFEHRHAPLMNRAAYEFSRATGRPVLVVHYRLAPAHPYPQPLDDVLAAYRALVGSGVPAAKIIMLGESSGATLTLSMLLRLKETGEQLPAGVLTWSAVTDLAVTGASVDDSPNDPVTRELLTRLIGRYLGGAPGDRAPQSPLYGDLAELPPLVMVVGGAEALRDDTLRFAEKASTAGTKVEVDVYEQMPHVFQTAILEPGNALGRSLLDRIARWGRAG
ncbi:alpha/beta hydrolase [Actinoplanes sp. NPDC049316]|uniref:alpha/beta hydrolase n=1 Tax=Actinoplanes sp. NPDC049316 TaxID=3154727 RepID=UPI0034138236